MNRYSCPFSLFLFIISMLTPDDDTSVLSLLLLTISQMPPVLVIIKPILGELFQQWLILYVLFLYRSINTMFSYLILVRLELLRPILYVNWNVGDCARLTARTTIPIASMLNRMNNTFFGLETLLSFFFYCLLLICSF